MSGTPENADGRWILLATILASSMAFIDSTALNVALPALQADLGASGSQLLWIVNAYQFLLSALILVGGSLGDIYGRRRIFILGVSIFAAASAACGLSPTGDFMIAARAFQGAGGALMVPGSLAIISAAFSQESRGRAIGTWSAFTTVTTIIGPVLGGFLASAGLWRGVFFLNLPLAAVVLAATLRGVPESRDEGADELDLPGTLLIVLGLGGITFGAIEAPERSLSDPSVLISLAIGGAALLAFIPVERRRRSPIVPLKLFQSDTFAGANLLTLLLYAALQATFFFLPLTLIQAHGYEARAAGLALLPFTVLLAGLSRWSGDLVERTGPRLFLVVGPALTSLGFLLMSLPGLTDGPGQYWTTFLPGVAVAGLGMGLTVAPLTTTVMGAVPERSMGAASGINNAVSRVAGVLAIAVLGALALSQFRGTLIDRARELGLPSDAVGALAEESRDFGQTSVPDTVPAEQRTQVDLAIAGSLADTFQLMALLCAGMAGASAVIGGVWIEGKSPREGLKALLGED